MPDSTSFSVSDKQNWVALWSVPGIGISTFWRIIRLLRELCVNWTDFWANNGQIIEKMCLTKKHLESIQYYIKEHKISSIFPQLLSQQISVVCFPEPTYPVNLQQLPNPPPVLFIKACPDVYDLKKLNLNHLLGQQSLAVVGTRVPSMYGQMVTQQLVTELNEYQLPIVSGFMRGVDVLAHQTAIKNQVFTLGVLGFGFLHMYPHRHIKLFTQLLEKGMIFVSEFTPETPPTLGTFVVRNRLIAGLSSGVLVTEATADSGSLITANWADKLHKPVFTVPGPIHTPFAAGCKKLLDQGAHLVTSGDDIMDFLRRQPQVAGKTGTTAVFPSQTHPAASLPELTHRQLQWLQQLLGDNWSKQSHLFCQQILAQLRQQPAQLPELLAGQPGSVEQVTVLLNALELLGLAKCQGGRWMLVH